MTPKTANRSTRSSGTARSRERIVPRRRGADAYDTLLWRLQPQIDDNRGAGFMAGITSCDRGAGVSTVAANLAIRAADHHMQPVLLVDANAAYPKVARKFRMRNALGLSDVLAGQCSVQDAIHASQIEGLEVMPLGTAGLMDRVGLDHQQLEGMLDGFRESHDLIVFDLPEVSELRHMLLVARQLDAAILAIRSEATPASVAQRAASQLQADGVNLFGSVLTHQRQYVPNWLRRRL